MAEKEGLSLGRLINLVLDQVAEKGSPYIERDVPVEKVSHVYTCAACLKDFSNVKALVKHVQEDPDHWLKFLSMKGVNL
jgi:hypothetical protein